MDARLRWCWGCGILGHHGSAQRKRAHRAFNLGKRFGNDQIGILLFQHISGDVEAFGRGASALNLSIMEDADE